LDFLFFVLSLKTMTSSSAPTLYAAAALADKKLVEILVAHLPAPERKAALARHKAHKVEVKKAHAAYVKELSQFPPGTSPSQKEIIRKARLDEARAKVSTLEAAAAEAGKRLNEIFTEDSGSESD
jgi:hypothetical protein